MDSKSFGSAGGGLHYRATAVTLTGAASGAGDGDGDADAPFRVGSPRILEDLMSDST